ncbi:class I SAM-dependent methyltransferase [Clostridium swellfunianum]|uniref:class I SAM-dependent methyltransferase n=1 Tax=Clostridium swellfunianum TaxID=1367462 RepID=UPI00202FCC48|nr:class I SAM-dependent methyltransferase [Clostridium swellfunianum]MCM0649118.1 class I SAM-dependent methyltransferase [Clostridium swellfunianum]
MVKSKEWNWAEVKENIWNEPSEDVYYYVSRWKKQGFKKFLDLGCGLGRHSVLFAENGFDTYSLDLSDFGLNALNTKAEQLGLEVKTVLGDINNLPYEDNMFDCLLSYHVISHTDTQGIKVIIGEINRVLKNGGEFFITLCSKNSPSYTKKNYPKLDENTIVKTEEPEAGVPHFYSDLNGVKDLLGNFEVIRIRHIEDIYEDTSGWHYFIHGRKR